jgi:hypothetical protein
MMERRRSRLAAGLALAIEIAQQDELDICGVSDSSDNAISMCRIDVDDAPTVALGSAKVWLTA